MSGQWNGETLLAPIAGENPCGRSLDASQLLALDSHRVFAQGVPLDEPLAKDERGRTFEQGRTPKPANSPEWLEIRDAALEALTRSKDLRVLGFVGAAVLRTDGVAAFCQTVTVASAWLGDYWDTVYPLVTEDSTERQSALSCFGDQYAVVDMIRKMSLVGSRQHGQFGLREIEQGAGQATGQGPVDAAFDEWPLEDLQGFRQQVTGALHALRVMESRMREADPESLLSFDSVSAQLTKVERVLRAQLARRPGALPDGDTLDARGAGGDVERAAAAGVGAIRSRQDAIRALEAVAAFFQQTEPSSPVPLLLERAKRLVSKSFLEVLADLAPGALGEARVASGVKSE
jgi:type VI secretion system protein ImpA